MEFQVGDKVRIKDSSNSRFYQPSPLAWQKIRVGKGGWTIPL